MRLGMVFFSVFFLLFKANGAWAITSPQAAYLEDRNVVLKADLRRPCGDFLSMGPQELVKKDQAIRLLPESAEPCRTQVWQRLEEAWSALKRDLEAAQARKGIFLQERPEAFSINTVEATCDLMEGVNRSGIKTGGLELGEIALTFDDGPLPTQTPRVLEVLERYGIKATFFLQGDRSTRFPETVRQTDQAGHSVGSHSWDHEAFSALQRPTQVEHEDPVTGEVGDVTRPPITAEQVYQTEVVRGHQAVEAALGKTSFLFRFPYGDVGRANTPEGPAVFFRTVDSGLRPFFWNMDSGDWARCTTRDECMRTLYRDLYESNPHPSLRDLHGRTRYEEGCGWDSAHARSFPRTSVDPESEGNPLRLLLDREVEAMDYQCGGIFLFHDVHTQSALALPWLLEEMRLRHITLTQFTQPEDEESHLLGPGPQVPTPSDDVRAADVCNGRYSSR